MSSDKVRLIVKWIIQQTFPFLPHNLCLGTIHGIRKYQGFVFKIHVLVTPFKTSSKLGYLSPTNVTKYKWLSQFQNSDTCPHKCYEILISFLKFSPTPNAAVALVKHSSAIFFLSSLRMFSMLQWKRCLGSASASFGPNFRSRNEILLWIA